MSVGVVTKHLIQLVAMQVEEALLVVWYDPEGHYGSVAASLAFPETTIARYQGSFLQLRRDIDHILNDLHPPRLVVYVPIDQAETDHALIELEAAGVVVQPGQQPPTRNTRLSLVARNALKPGLGEARAADIEKQVEAGKLTLADLDRLGDQPGGGVLSIVFGTGNPQEVALAFLSSDHYDVEVQKKKATEELVGLLRPTFDADLATDAPLAEVRDRLARHVLMTDLVACLGPALPSSLSSEPVKKLYDGCRSLVRSPCPEFVARRARPLETSLEMACFPLRATDGHSSLQIVLGVDRRKLGDQQPDQGGFFTNSQ